MTFLDSLERRFGHLAIPGLIRIVVVLNALVYLIGTIDPKMIGLLELNPQATFGEGQYWRLITFLFIPKTMSPIFIIFALLFLWNIGDSLEAVWGSFRLNLFYLIGAVGAIVAATFFGAQFSNMMLNVSLLFAYAWFFPNVMLLFPPIPMRWMAWIVAAFIGVGMVTQGLAYQGAVVASLANFLIFFGPEALRNIRQRETTARRRRKFEEASAPVEESLHRCATCGRTEKGHPELDFRVSRDGNEYCSEHLPPPVGKIP